MSEVLEALSAESRVITADWRLHVLSARSAMAKNRAFPTVRTIALLIRSGLQRGVLAHIEGVSGVYRVVVPYARSIPVPEEAIAQEANPTAVFSFASAFVHHGLTGEAPGQMFLTEYKPDAERLPHGTSPEDWLDVPRPQRRRPDAIGGRTVVWTSSLAKWDFGHQTGLFESSPIYVTDLERTLVDSLRAPEKCGGILHAVRAWRQSRPIMNVDRIIDYADRLGQAVLRQRVGFTIEALGLSHARLDEWAGSSVRGGSARLVASETFAPQHSERWNLSLNAPESILLELQHT